MSAPEGYAFERFRSLVQEHWAKVYGETLSDEEIHRMFAEFAEENPNLCAVVDKIPEARAARGQG